MKVTQVKKENLYELSQDAAESLKDSKYYNEDLAPTKIKERKWTVKDIMNLWIGLSVSIPALALSSSLVALGVSPVLAILNVILGNLIVLVPIQLNSHIGTKYGIPYPIFARLTFGIKGVHLSCISRSIIGCGWTSIQSWVGGGAIAALVGIVFPYFSDSSQTISLPGNDNVIVGQFIGFIIFVLLCGWVAYNGMKKIKFIQNLGGPILLVIIFSLFVWSVMTINKSGHSVLDVFTVGNNLALIKKHGGFLFVYLAGLTGNISYWSTVALSIPDFSKMAKSQKDQFYGQLFGMPIPMAVCAIVGALFAQATFFANGNASFDPTVIFYSMNNRLVIAICALGVIMATLTTCVAANVVSPSNGWSNIAPSKISFKTGVVITIAISIFVTEPWFIYGSGSSYIFTWLNNYGTIIAPVAAILLADYFCCKKTRVDLYSLYRGKGGRYEYSKGWNWCAVIAWGVSVIFPLLGNSVLSYSSSGRSSPNLLDMIAANGYIFSFIAAFFSYIVLMKSSFFYNRYKKSYVSLAEETEFTGTCDL